MNSRERVLAAVERREPDRVPIDFGATRQTGIMAAAYDKLKKYLGIRGETFVYDIYQMLAEVEEPVRRRMHTDVVALSFKRVAFGVPNEGRKEWCLNDGTKVLVSSALKPELDRRGNYYVLDEKGDRIARMPPGGFYFDKLRKGPGAAHVDPDKWELPELEEDELRWLEHQARFFRRETDYAVIGEMRQVELFYGLGEGGFDDWMVTLLSEQNYVRELYEKALQGMLKNFDLYYQAVGERMDIVKFTDDFGMQTGEFAHPDLLRSLVLPYYKRYIEHIKKRNEKLKIFQHCCGSIFNILGDMIDIGVEIINPVQTSAANMDPGKLKETYGGRVCFWGGGVDNQRVLPFGSSREVADQAAGRLEIFKPGGGFVFATIHNIQQNTPPENIAAAFDTAFEKGAYS
ncbi:MAG TPA: uroporphyrinogen decarboxylase family protein [archaeon]|nr:uroporphyrinogen decarboxylase family protein [archaeon]